MIAFYITIYIINIVALFFLFSLIRDDNLVTNQRKKVFSFAIILTILVILSELGTILTAEEGSGFRNLHVLFNVLGFMLTPVVPILLITIFGTEILRKNKVLLLPTIINSIAALLSPFIGLIFSIDIDNNYARGSLFFIFIFVYIFNIILLIIITWYYGQKRYSLIKWKIFFLGVFVVAGTGIQVFVPSVYSSWHCVTITLFLLYIILSRFEGNFDVLTKLYNRAAFEKTSEHLSNKNKFIVITLDIDNFKGVNDYYGHDFGDAVLKDIAFIIQKSFDDSCSSYRIGGDEFCVICRNGSKEKLKQQLDFMTDLILKKRQENNHLPTVSYGYYSSQDAANLDFQAVLKEADRLMYYNKHLKQKKSTQIEGK